MFPIKLFPLFIIGCALVPTLDGEVESKPTNDPNVDPVDDSIGDPFQSADFESMDSMEIRSAIYEDMAVLQNLEIVEVGDVLLDLPDEALCAYNWTPCQGFEDEVDDALREVGPRLDALAHYAQLAAAEAVTPDDDSCTAAVILENLEALENLEILVVGDLLVEEPELNCPYFQPCDEDIVAAQQITCERADTLDRIVLVTQEI